MNKINESNQWKIRNWYFVRTQLSKPKKNSIKKKIMAQNCGNGNIPIASGYVMNAKDGPPVATDETGKPVTSVFYSEKLKLNRDTLVTRQILLTWHESEHRKYNKAGEDARRTIYNWHKNSITVGNRKLKQIICSFNVKAGLVPFAVVPEIIVARHVHNATPSFGKFKINDVVFVFIRFPYLDPTRRIFAQRRRPKPTPNINENVIHFRNSSSNGEEQSRNTFRLPNSCHFGMM